MRRLLLAGMCLLMAVCTGCTKSTIVNVKEETVEAEPVFETQENVEIDWEQVSDEAQDLFEDRNEYSYSRDFLIFLEPQEKLLQLLWVVDDDFPTSEMDRYANDMLKRFNDIVATQDFSIEPSSEESYGGLWKEYGIAIGIMPDGTKEDRETWFLDASYEADSDFALPSASAIAAEMKRLEREGSLPAEEGQEEETE